LEKGKRLRMKKVFELYDFLSLRIVKTSGVPIIRMVYPVSKRLAMTKSTSYTLTGSRTTWHITVAPTWDEKLLDVMKDGEGEEKSHLLITPTKFSQWPHPRVKPLTEKIHDSEAIVTFFGYENWDTYLNVPPGRPMA
jgi:hypothetical protein